MTTTLKLPIPFACLTLELRLNKATPASVDAPAGDSGLARFEPMLQRTVVQAVRDRRRRVAVLEDR